MDYETWVKQLSLKDVTRLHFQQHSSRYGAEEYVNMLQPFISAMQVLHNAYDPAVWSDMVHVHTFSTYRLAWFMYIMHKSHQFIRELYYGRRDLHGYEFQTEQTPDSSYMITTATHPSKHSRIIMSPVVLNTFTAPVRGRHYHVMHILIQIGHFYNTGGGAEADIVQSLLLHSLFHTQPPNPPQFVPVHYRTTRKQHPLRASSPNMWFHIYYGRFMLHPGLPFMYQEASSLAYDPQEDSISFDQVYRVTKDKHIYAMMDWHPSPSMKERMLSGTKDCTLPTPEVPLFPCQEKTLRWMHDHLHQPFMSSILLDIDPDHNMICSKWGAHDYHPRWDICGGFIANPVGTGKTRIIMEASIWWKDESFLIFIPHHLMNHWAAEAKKWIPYEDYALFRTLKDFKQLPRKPRILVISYIVFRHHIPLIEQHCWDHIVMDEAHKLKWNILDHLKCKHLWGMSATPQIAFDRAFAWTAGRDIRHLPKPLHEMMLHGASTFRQKPQRTIHHLTYEVPVPQPDFWKQVVTLLIRYHKSPGIPWKRIFHILDRLSGITRPFSVPLMLSVLETLMTPERSSSGSNSVRGLSQQLSVDRPQASECAYGTEVDDCPICMVTLENPIQFTCRHLVCKKCVSSMIRVQCQRCPLCRQNIRTFYQPRFQHDVGKESTKGASMKDTTNKRTKKRLREDRSWMHIMNEASHTSTVHPKLNILDIILTRYPVEDKMVIFTSCKYFAREVYHHLHPHHAVGTVGFGLTHERFDTIMDRFQNGHYRILILSHQYSVGIDLSLANHAIVMEQRENQSYTTQAIGRVTRANQTKDMFIHHIMFKHGMDGFRHRYRSRYGDQTSFRTSLIQFMRPLLVTEG
jgi:hypothetical protein